MWTPHKGRHLLEEKNVLRFFLWSPTAFRGGAVPEILLMCVYTWLWYFKPASQVHWVHLSQAQDSNICWFGLLDKQNKTFSDAKACHCFVSVNNFSFLPMFNLPECRDMFNLAFQSICKASWFPMGFVFMVRQLSIYNVDKIVTRSETSVKLAFQLFLKSIAICRFMVRQLAIRIFMIFPILARVSVGIV